MGVGGSPPAPRQMFLACTCGARRWDTSAFKRRPGVAYCPVRMLFQSAGLMEVGFEREESCSQVGGLPQHLGVIIRSLCPQEGSWCLWGSRRWLWLSALGGPIDKEGVGKEVAAESLRGHGSLQKPWPSAFCTQLYARVWGLPPVSSHSSHARVSRQQDGLASVFWKVQETAAHQSSLMMWLSDSRLGLQATFLPSL